MNGVKVLAFVLFIVVQATSQDAPSVFPFPPNVFHYYPVPRFLYAASQVPYSAIIPQNASNPFPTVPQMPHAVPQDPSKMFPYAVPPDGTVNPPEQAQCKFSDGKMITVDYSTRHVKADDLFFFPFVPPPMWATVFNGIRFVTDESLITVKGMSVPAGDYTIVVPQNTYPNVFLYLITGQKGGESHVPVSLTYLASPAEKSAISFEHTGGSCMMQVNWKNWKQQGSVEFTEKNADLPLAN
jgi:hypothetical protein